MSALCLEDGMKMLLTLHKKKKKNTGPWSNKSNSAKQEKKLLPLMCMQPSSYSFDMALDCLIYCFPFCFEVLVKKNP